MLNFKREKKELVYQGKIINVYKDYLVTPDEKKVVYDLVEHKHGGGAAVLLIDEFENCILVEQYRNTLDKTSLEIPAGMYNFPKEPGDICARREAEEETGYIPKNIFYICNTISAVGVYSERVDIFIGINLKKSNTNLDPNEFIDIKKIHISKCIEMIFNGEIIDSKTIIAIMGYKEAKDHFKF